MFTPTPFSLNKISVAVAISLIVFLIQVTPAGAQSFSAADVFKSFGSAVPAVIPVRGPASTAIGYSKNRFYLTVKNVKKVSYTIEYQRTNRGGNTTEGLQGGGKANRNGVYTASSYAGTQSSKYFIPHNVVSGTVTVKATTTGDSPYNYSTNFTIKKGKLILSK